MTQAPLEYLFFYCELMSHNENHPHELELASYGEFRDIEWAIGQLYERNSQAVFADGDSYVVGQIFEVHDLNVIQRIIDYKKRIFGNNEMGLVFKDGTSRKYYETGLSDDPEDWSPVSILTTKVRETDREISSGTWHISRSQLEHMLDNHPYYSPGELIATGYFETDDNEFLTGRSIGDYLADLEDDVRKLTSPWYITPKDTGLTEEERREKLLNASPPRMQVPEAIAMQNARAFELILFEHLLADFQLLLRPKPEFRSKLVPEYRNEILIKFHKIRKLFEAGA